MICFLVDLIIFFSFWTSLYSWAILANSSCDLDSFSSRVDDDNLTGLYPCSVVESKDVEDISFLVALVEVLNNGFDSVESITVNEDLKKKFDEFKAKIVSDPSQIITEDDILAYLDEHN